MLDVRRSTAYAVIFFFLCSIGTAAGQQPAQPASGSTTGRDGAASAASDAGGDGLTGLSLKRTEGGFLVQTPSDSVFSQELLDLNVVHEDHGKIGEVNEVIVDDNGLLVGVVVDVGGFLGIGTKHVGIPRDRFILFFQEGRDHVRTNVTPDEAKAAPEFHLMEVTAVEESGAEPVGDFQSIGGEVE